MINGNDIIHTEQPRNRKTSNIIATSLTAVVFFVTGFLFGKNDYKLQTIKQNLKTIKNTVRNSNIRSSIHKEQQKTMNYDANDVKQNDPKMELQQDEASADIISSPQVPPVPIKQIEAQAEAPVVIKENIDQTTTEGNIGSESKKDAENSSVANEQRGDIDNNSSIVETEQTTKNTKDTVYVVMVNNNATGGNSGQISKIDNDAKTEQLVAENKIKKQKQKSNKSRSQTKRIKSKNIKSKTKIIKQKQIAGDSNSTEKMIENKPTNKTENTNNSEEKEELIIEFENDGEQKKAQDVNVETLIVVDNETGEDYEIIPDNKTSTNDNASGKKK